MAASSNIDWVKGLPRTAWEQIIRQLSEDDKTNLGSCSPTLRRYCNIGVSDLVRATSCSFGFDGAIIYDRQANTTRRWMKRLPVDWVQIPRWVIPCSTKAYSFSDYRVIYVAAFSRASAELVIRARHSVRFLRALCDLKPKQKKQVLLILTESPEPLISFCCKVIDPWEILAASVRSENAWTQRRHLAFTGLLNTMVEKDILPPWGSLLLFLGEKPRVFRYAMLLSAAEHYKASSDDVLGALATFGKGVLSRALHELYQYSRGELLVRWRCGEIMNTSPRLAPAWRFKNRLELLIAVDPPSQAAVDAVLTYVKQNTLSDLKGVYAWTCHALEPQVKKYILENPGN